MSDERADLILNMLPAIRITQDEHGAQAGRGDYAAQRARSRFRGMKLDFAGIHVRLDNISRRLDRVERRQDLVDERTP